jgi:hypothetical protein
MVKIGIITPILIHDLHKYINNIKILEDVEQIYNDFIEENHFKKSDIILVSNGYPWINHIPVSIFLKSDELEGYAGIELCMPTEINPKEHKFLNTHEGRVLNDLFLKYKDISGLDGLDNLARIVQARKPNKKQIIKRGYKQANTMMVRNCDYVLFFGLSETPTDELWDKILCKKAYFDISKFNLI